MGYYTLKEILSSHASAWATEAVRYRRGLSHSPDTADAFWFGMCSAFEDSTDELLELLHTPTVQGVFTFIQALELRRNVADQFLARLTDELLLYAYTLGVAEAYKTCVEYLTDALIEQMLSVNTRVEYPS